MNVVPGYTEEINAQTLADRLARAQYISGLSEALVRHGVDVPNDCVTMSINAPVDGVVEIRTVRFASIEELKSIDVALKSFGV